MKPVEMRNINGRPGDCLNACVASILDLPYEQVPFFNLYGDGWHYTYVSFMRSHGWGLWEFAIWGCDVPLWQFGTRQTGYKLYVPGYWLASVLSPRIIDEHGKSGLHAVVMKGNSVAWDPHPQRDMGHLGFIEATILVPA